MKVNSSGIPVDPYRVAPRAHPALVTLRVRIAVWDRERHGNPVRPSELLHHSDACPMRAPRFAEPPAAEDIAPSIGSVEDAYDIGLMESIIGLLETKAIATVVFRTGPYKTVANAEYDTASWVD